MNLLEGVIKSYCNEVPKLSGIHDKQSFLAAWLMQSNMPRTLLEKGLDIGDNNLVRAVLETNPEVRINGVIPVYIVKVEGLMIDIIGRGLQKSQDYFEWQQWRLKGIVDGSYAGYNFPKWEDEEFLLGDSNSAIIKSNQRRIMGTEIEIGEGIHRREGKIYSKAELNSSHDYRFNYRAILDPLLLTKE